MLGTKLEAHAVHTGESKSTGQTEKLSDQIDRKKEKRSRAGHGKSNNIPTQERNRKVTRTPPTPTPERPPDTHHMSAAPTSTRHATPPAAQTSKSRNSPTHLISPSARMRAQTPPAASRVHIPVPTSQPSKTPRDPNFFACDSVWAQLTRGRASRHGHAACRAARTAYMERLRRVRGT
ncbi:hypothetical protein BDY17DRAFT_33369 [Neohortaea acidophila]|uniref:Uncharacterized protein n=1 Tax=Neohortaea acidophila TaxID=245834 RepID=A0A6A6PJR8_9PEZI|nr:uncharacterized protein BDY17DRAFT_33369 [Neohortaea acidophila]KAF2480175.1 hypothetical protein BDY17DRAFT_33369 [Neohortaea acidophila]